MDKEGKCNEECEAAQNGDDNGEDDQFFCGTRKEVVGDDDERAPRLFYAIEYDRLEDVGGHFTRRLGDLFECVKLLAEEFLTLALRLAHELVDAARGIVRLNAVGDDRTLW